MLVLSRRVGEGIVIGEGITLTVLAVEGQRVRLGIEAPECVSIWREELTFDPVDGTGGHQRSEPAASRPSAPVRSETPLA